MKKVFLNVLLIVCINYAFSQTETISQINIGSADLTINSTTSPFGGPEIHFARSGSSPSYSMGYDVFPAQGSGRFKLRSSVGGGFVFTSLLFKIESPLLVGGSNFSMPSGFKFAVDGKAIAEEMWVQNSSAWDWPDYVFADNYELRSLNEVASFIDKNSHLPEVPSAKEIEEKGINTGEMHAILLKKIEELTLYVIENKNETNLLNKKVSKLQIENELLKKQLSTEK